MTDEQDTRYGWFVAVVICLCSACAIMDRSVLPLLVKPLEQSLGLTDTTVGLLQGAAFSVAFGLFGLPLARLADNGNRRNIILAGVFAWSAATIACGLVHSVHGLFAARMLVGVSEAVLTPAAVSLLSDYFSVRRRTRAISMNSLGVYLGSGLSLLFGGTLMRALGPTASTATPLGSLETWRIVFIAVGLSGVVLIPLLLAVREPVRHAAAETREAQGATFGEVLAVFREKRAALASCIGGFTLLVMGHHAVIGWAPTVFVRNHGWELARTGQTLGLLNIVMSPLGVMAGALLSERFERAGRSDGKLLVGVVSGIGCALAALAFTLPIGGGSLVALAVLQFVVTFNFGLTHAAIAQLLPNRARAFGSACFVASTNIISASLGPLLVGLLDDHVFHDKAMLAVSIRWVAPIAFLAGATVLSLGRAAFRGASGGAARPAPAFPVLEPNVRV